MPSRSKQMTGPAIERRKKAGRGQGEHAEYDPWIYTTDFSAHSTCSQITNWKDLRRTHLLSFGERKEFLCHEFADSIKQVREGCVLNLEETVEIARLLGVAHPRKKGELMVMTVDFYLDIATPSGIVYVARDFKPRADLCKKRTLIKLEITRRYFSVRNVDWGIVTEDDIPEHCWWNIHWLHPRREIDSLYPLTPSQVQSIGDFLSSVIAGSKEVVLADICEKADLDLRIASGESLAVARFMLANKAWLTDMRTKRFEPGQPATIRVGDVAALWRRVCQRTASAKTR
jgi:hypothetical protein